MLTDRPLTGLEKMAEPRCPECHVPWEREPHYVTCWLADVLFGLRCSPLSIEEGKMTKEEAWDMVASAYRERKNE